MSEEKREDENFRNLIEHGEYLSRIEEKVRRSEEAKEEVVGLDKEIFEVEKKLKTLHDQKANLEKEIVETVGELQRQISSDTEKLFEELKNKHKKTNQYTGKKNNDYIWDSNSTYTVKLDNISSNVYLSSNNWEIKDGDS